MTMASSTAYALIVDQLPLKRGRIYAEIRAYGGTTINNGCFLTNWPYSTVSARFYELAEDGLIKDSGEKRDGQTVWVVAEPEEREALRAARKAAKRYETEVVGFHGIGGPAAFGPEQLMSVEVYVPRRIWQTFKNPVRVRFLTGRKGETVLEEFPTKTKRYVYLPAAVRGDHIFSNTVAPSGVYERHENPEGAVSVRATNGKFLGLKPNEYVDAGGVIG